MIPNDYDAIVDVHVGTQPVKTLKNRRALIRANGGATLLHGDVLHQHDTIGAAA